MTRLLASLILLISTHTFAAETWYQVNLVVFENRNPVTGDETFEDPHQQALEIPADIVELDENNAADENLVYGFRNLPVTDEEFKKVLGSLQRSSGYKVLAIKSWRQPEADRDQARPVLIQAGDAYGQHYRIEGSVRLVVSRYLHLEADLWLGDYVQQLQAPDAWWQQDENGATDTLEAPEESGAQTSVTYYEATRLVRMKESRRMRSGEMHYLDNPMFGLLVKVTPMKDVTPITTGKAPIPATQ